MKKVSRKSIAIAAVAIVTCAVLGLAAFILFHDDKPVYTPSVSTHELSTSDLAMRENTARIAFTLGPDVTGKSYDIKVYRTETEESAGVTFISINDGKKQKVVDDDGYSGYLWDVVSAIDDDGKPIIAVNMDYMSDDYFFVMYTIENGRLVRCGSEEAMLIKFNTDRSFTASYAVNFFGTWGARRTLNLTAGNRIQLEEGDYRLNVGDERKITALANIKAELADAEGNYKDYTLKKGSEISLYATDGKSYVLFTDEKGNKGRIKATFKDGFTYIGDKEDFELFSGIIYAG